MRRSLALVVISGLFWPAAHLPAQTSGPLVVRPRDRRPPRAVPPAEQPASAESPRTAPVPIKIETTGDEFLDRAREAVFGFSSKLPNFFCEQVTSRLVSFSNPPKWELEDRVSAEVMYVDGTESYRDIRRNGRPVRDGAPANTGAWSSGEFASVMQGLFHPISQTSFTNEGESEIAGVPARLYDFHVAEANSQWSVTLDETTLHPSYAGSVWFDPESRRVLRIEMRAADLPAGFGLDVVELSVDYGAVDIGGQEYLLATKAANLGCQRGTRICTLNEIEFRNYRRFTAESTIRIGPVPGEGAERQ